jgi:ABC-type nitrate/sulfonate/bicarbonate transport system substrate-binding protein
MKVEAKMAMERLNRPRRRLLLAASGCLFGGALAEGAQVQQSLLTEVTLSVPGPGSSVSLVTELAVKIGADKAEGLVLRLKFVDGGGVAIQDINSGNSEFGVFGLPAAMHGNLKQARLVALAAIDDLPLYTLMVRADLRGRVRRIEDLKGRVIGIHSNSLATKTTSHQVADLVLRGHGLSPADVSYIAAGQNWESQSSAFIGKAVDASMCDEPFGTRLASEKLAFQLFSTGDPANAKKTPGAGFLRAALIARRDRVDANPVPAERMVKVVKRALEWMDGHKPEEIADVLAMTSVERRSFIDVSRKYPRQYSRDARFSKAQLRDTEIFFRASDPDNPEARRYAIDAMIVDQWAGTKP